LKMEANAGETASPSVRKMGNAAVGSLPLNNERLLWMGSL
jgi:hypothetical protein